MKRIMKDAVVLYFMAQCEILLVGTKENHEELQSG
jgi:hypothetical protein